MHQHVISFCFSLCVCVCSWIHCFLLKVNVIRACASVCVCVVSGGGGGGKCMVPQSLRPLNYLSSSP